jgi:hypothetical protein
MAVDRMQRAEGRGSKTAECPVQGVATGWNLCIEFAGEVTGWGTRTPGLVEVGAETEDSEIKVEFLYVLRHGFTACIVE